MIQRPRFFSISRPVAGLAILLAGLLFFLTRGPGWMPGWGGGAGAGPNAAPGGGNAPAKPLVDSRPQAETPSKPLEITIDDNRYLVLGTPIQSVAELVKLAQEVPQDVPPPRVRIVRRPTARYTAEKNLEDALKAAKVDYVKQ